MVETAVEAGGIGQPVLRKEDLRLLRGRGRFTDDIRLDGQAHAAMLRSPHAHARIAGIDTGPARAMPGVLDVLTADDLAGDGVGTIPSYSQIAGLVDLVLENADGSARRGTELPVLAGERVRFVGDIVAAAIAETPAAAIDAAERIAVAYEPLDAVTETAAAPVPGAPRLWDDIPGNTCIDGFFGDPEETERAFSRAAHVVSLKTRVQRVTGVMMEPRAAVAQYDARSGRFTLYSGGDNPVRVKRDLAVLFGVAEDRVRVVAGDVGGNFGTRNWTYPEYAIALWAAKRLGRPVKWTASRSESFLADYQGRDLVIDAALALDADGRFLALRSSLISNVGGYTVSFVPITKSSELAPTVYAFPAAHVSARAVMSNTPSTAPYRSAGRPEAMLAMERLVDLAAREHGFDPVELRRRNLVPASAMPYRTALGLVYDSGDYVEAMDRALRLADWDGFPARREEARARGRLRGTGLANSIEITSGFPVERAGIAVLPEGGIEIVIGTLSSGQGHETAFAQCVADWLGAPFDAIRLITGDTDIVPEGGGSHSARSMRMAGIVMGRASELVIEKGKALAADMLEAAMEDMVFESGRFAIEGTDRSVTLFEVAGVAESRGERLAAEHTEKMSAPGFPYGTQVCEVEIDPETGAIEVVRYAAVDDVGRAVNPLILHGQAHGGIVQGAGQALFEHARYDPGTGQMLAGSLMDYAIARADDFPFFDTEIMEVPSPTNPLGVRGGGEGGTTPALAAVVNAICDALAEHGVRHIEMPATPERIWRMIRRAAEIQNEGGMATQTLSERADAYEEQQLRELGDRLIAKSLLYNLADGVRKHGHDGPAGGPGSAALLMGEDPRLPPMPEKPTLFDFFKLRFSPARAHVLQSANLAQKNGLPEKMVLACLLHDIAVLGFIRADHGYWGAQLVQPYVDEEVSWAIRMHQALRFFPDESVGYEYPDAYVRMFGADYEPEPYIVAAYEEARKHKWYMSSRMIVVNDLYAFDPDVEVELEQFEDVVGRHFKQPPEGLGNDNSPSSHMWRTLRRPCNAL